MITPLVVVVHVTLMCWFMWMYWKLGKIFLPPRFGNWRVRLTVGAAFTLMLILTRYCLPSATAMMAARLTIYLGFALAMYRGHVVKKLMVATYYVMLVLAGEALTVAMMGMMGIGKSMTIDGVTFFTGVFFWVLLQFTRGIKQTIDSRLGWRAWLKIAYCVATTFLITNQFWYLYYQYVGRGNVADIFSMNGRDVLSLTLVLMQFGVVYMLFSIVHEMNRNMEALSRSRMDEMKARHDLEQSRLMVESADKIYRLQHDMKNHLLAIDALSGDWERQHAYIGKLTQELMPENAQPLCGNRLIDSLIALKLSRMEKCGIRCELALSPVPDDLALDDAGLCSVITNALDNAIEACERLQAGWVRRIALNVRMDGGNLYLKVANPCENAGAVAAGALSRRKGWLAKAGTGLDNMRRAVHNMGGEMALGGNDADDEVALSIFIPGAAGPLDPAAPSPARAVLEGEA